MSSFADEPKGGLGPNAARALEDEAWERYQAEERKREEAKHKVEGPRPVHVEPTRQVGHVILDMAQAIPRRDAVSFVIAWDLLVRGADLGIGLVHEGWIYKGELEGEVFYQDFAPVTQVEAAKRLWFDFRLVMAQAFGPGWERELRHGQAKGELRQMDAAIGNWLTEVKDGLGLGEG